MIFPGRRIRSYDPTRRTPLGVLVLLAAIPVVVAILLFAGPSRAETASAVDLSTGWISGTRAAAPFDLRYLPLRITPSLVLDQPNARLSIDARATRSGDVLRFDRLRATGTFFSRWTSRLAGEFQLDARGSEALEGGTDAEFRGRARLHYAARSAGAWLGLAPVRSSRATEQDRMSLLDLGAWARRRRLSLSTYLDQTVALVRSQSQHRSLDSMAVGLGREHQVIPLSKYVIVSTVQTILHWSGERLEVDAGGGTTFSARSRPQRWLQAGAALWLSPSIAISANAGTRPRTAFRIEGPAPAYLTLGVRVATSRAASPAVPLVAAAQALEWAVQPLANGRWLMRVRALGARTVELMGDVTDWSPVALQKVNAEWWEVSLPLTAGVHQVDLRLDGGEWAPPPGMPTVRDGYSGDVGVVVID